MIRHAEAAAFPVVPLPVAVIEPPLLALLVLPPGVLPLLTALFLPASVAAVPVAPVTMTTDPEHRATANTPANPPAQELLAGPHPRPIGGRGPPRPVMAISIPSADDVGPFFRVGAKNPDPCLRSRFFLSACGHALPTPRQASLAATAQPLTIGAHPKKRGPEACYPLSPFPLGGAECGPFLSGGHERMRAMARKRNAWVPTGEASGNLDGPVKAICSASPQARHHYTQADQVNQLVGASEADADLGFMARLIALCSLPRSNPGDQAQYIRENGPYALVMVAGAKNKLPYGNLPRLLLAWVCTEAVRTQNREVVLGRSLSKFMRTLGINSDSGGTRGEQTRLRNQMNRLFGCTVSLIYEDQNKRATVNALIARRTEFWWNPKRPHESTLWESKLARLSTLPAILAAHQVAHQRKAGSSSG